MALLDELLVGLGFEYDPKESKKFNDDLNKSIKIVKELTRVAVTGATAITAMVVASTLASDEQGKLANEIGETVENIDALQFALKRSGGTADGMSNSLRQLAIRSAEAARGVGSGVEAFGILGISVLDTEGKLKPTMVLMSEISDVFQGLSKAKQIELADKLGIRDSIRLLQQSRGTIAELTEEVRKIGVTTGEDALIAADFQDSLTDIWQITKQVSRLFSKTLAPILKEMNKEFTEWWKTNKDLIKLKLPEWIDKFAFAMRLLTVAVGTFLAFRLAGHIAVLISLFKTLGTAAVLANVKALLLPGLILLGVAAIAALVEDAKVFFEGGDSFIGDMLKKYPEWTAQINTIASVFGSMAELTTTIWDGWKGIFELFGKGSFFSTLRGVTSDQFILDALGIVDVQGGVLSDVGASSRNSSKDSRVWVGKVEISVPGAGDPVAVAEAVNNVFQQTAQDLNSTVDQ